MEKEPSEIFLAHFQTQQPSVHFLLPNGYKNCTQPLIIKAYRDAWDRPIPMNIGHDRTKPIGYTKLTGVYMEPGKAYVTNESAIMETSEEHETLRKMIELNDHHQFCEEHKDEIDSLVEKLKGTITDSFRVAPVGQAVAN